MKHLTLRTATIADAEAVTNIFLRSRKELVAKAPLVDSDEAIADWIESTLIPAERTTVALVKNNIVGFISISQDDKGSWIDHLYLNPDHINKKIGSYLLQIALDELPRPIKLYTFQCNQLARDFYEKWDFKAIEFTDGANNEEKCPDILYELLK